MAKVFHLIKSLGRGGAEKLLIENLRWFDRSRYECEYGYFLNWKNDIAMDLQDAGAKVTCFDCSNNLSILFSARRVADYVRSQKHDLLHCHLPIAGVVGRIAGQMTDLPVVYTEHNTLERYHPWTRQVNVRTWRWQQMVIAVSSEVADSIGAHSPGGVPTRVIHNGVDTNWFDVRRSQPRDVRRELCIPDDAPVVGTVAVFRTQKRLQDWLTAARLLLNQHRDLHLVVVGDGPLREELVRFAGTLGLNGRLHLPGLQQDVRPYLESMDVFAISSRFEGLPIALLEAMSMQRAVVSTAVGGIPEVIQSGENGFLVDPCAPEALAAAISHLLSNPEKAAVFGCRARETVVTRFGLQRMTRELEAAYDAVLDTK